MAANTKQIKGDVDRKPSPQYYNPVADEYEYLYGENGASRHILYGSDGQPITSSGNKLAVRASEIETLLSDIESKDFATQTTLAAILNKIIAAPATEAKQDTLIGHVDGVESALASILAKLIAAPATEAKQTALAALIGEVQASPTANTMLARLKSLEDKIDAIIDGTTPAVMSLSGSKAELASAQDTQVATTAKTYTKAAGASQMEVYCETGYIRVRTDGEVCTGTTGEPIAAGFASGWQVDSISVYFIQESVITVVSR